jgi:hypothetical protein
MAVTSARLGSQSRHFKNHQEKYWEEPLRIALYDAEHLFKSHTQSKTERGLEIAKESRGYLLSFRRCLNKRLSLLLLAASERELIQRL